MYRRINGERAQMHIIEILTAAIIMFSTTNFITTVASPPMPNQDALSNLRVMGDDALRALDNIVPPDLAATYHNSSLVKHVSTNDAGAMEAFIDAALPNTVSYAIYVTGESSTGSIRTFTLYEELGKPLEPATTSHRLIATNHVENWTSAEFTDGVLDVSMVMWYGLRGA